MAKENMGRKDSHSNQQPPVDHYRKSIGKQDYKKSKSELKESKNKALAKKAAPQVYTEISIMVGAMLVLIFSVYAIFYIILQKKTDGNDKLPLTE